MPAAVTTYLKLNVPAFDQMPWDTDVNNNWYILDAVVGLFSAIPNMTGMWQNATAYAVGQAVIDPADSTAWSCGIPHTSATAPTLFAQDRTTHPTYWTQISSGVQFYAIQAAGSATAAQNSANAAAASAAAAAVSAAGKLPLAGGTMTGPLILNAAPTATNGAATKGYVDTKAGNYLPLVGGGVLSNASASISLGLSRVAGQAASLASYTGGYLRWQIMLADSVAETGLTVGSNFEIARYNDVGSFVDYPVSINRASGVANFTQHPTLNGVPLLAALEARIAELEAKLASLPVGS